MAPPRSLLSIPPELVVQIVAHLDFPSLAAFVRVSRACHALVHAYPEHICRTVAIRTALADPRTVGATAPLAAPPWPVRPLDDDLDSDELERVVRSQGWMGTTHSVASWHAYARRAHSVHRNWLAGNATERCIVLDWSDASHPLGIGSFWRFKLDPSPGYIVVSGLDAGYYAFRHDDGKLAWSCAVPMSPYSHIELSEGYIPVQASDTQYFMLGRTDIITKDVEISDPVRHIHQLIQLHNGASVGYIVDAVLRTAHPCRASKLRFPTFLAAPANADSVHTYNVLTRESREVAVPEFTRERGEWAVTYVEVDDRALFLAGQDAVLLVRPDLPAGARAEDSSPRYRTWPPDPPDDFLAYSASWYPRECPGVGWHAVHHDARGGHLVGIGGRSAGGDGWAKLVWTCDYQDALWGPDRDRLEQKTVVLVIDGGDPVQLAVENGRAVFVAHDDELGSSLWLLNLRSFEDWADFNDDPPQPICLAYPLPTLETPSRVEMTSSAIYLPTLASFFTSPPFAPSRLSRAFNAMQRQVPPGKTPLAFHWEKLDGEHLACGDGAGAGAAAVQFEDDGSDSPQERRLARGPTPEIDSEDEGAWSEEEDDVGVDERERMRRAWRWVQRAAERDGVRGGGASDAFAVWEFAPPLDCS
ncbi:hypothetical protein JCM3770_001575 [Rhodotorula araucariae]